MTRLHLRTLVTTPAILAIVSLSLATKGSAASYPHANKPPPTTTASAPDATTTVTVQIDNFNFKPKELTISVGTTVTWVNNDDVPHTATAKGDTPLFDSKALDTDDKYSFTFTQ